MPHSAADHHHKVSHHQYDQVSCCFVLWILVCLLQYDGGHHCLLRCLFFSIQFLLTHSFFLHSTSSWLVVGCWLLCPSILWVPPWLLVLQTKLSLFLGLAALHETSSATSLVLLLLGLGHRAPLLVDLGASYKTFSIPWPGALHETSLVLSLVLMYSPGLGAPSFLVVASLHLGGSTLAFMLLMKHSVVLHTKPSLCLSLHWCSV